MKNGVPTMLQRSPYVPRCQNSDMASTEHSRTLPDASS